jgi:hypothetical protein
MPAWQHPSLRLTVFGRRDDKLLAEQFDLLRLNFYDPTELYLVK